MRVHSNVFKREPERIAVVRELQRRKGTVHADAYAELNRRLPLSDEAKRALDGMNKLLHALLNR